MTELDSIISTLRAVGAKDFSARVAKRAEVSIQASLQVTLSAGQTPEGKAWEPRKKGGRAYAKAASRVVTKASGDLIRVTLSGPEVFGHFGARGAPVRQMIPDAGAAIPESIQKALTDAAREVLAEVSR